MSWDERQRRMLAAMGVRLWSPATAESAIVPSGDAAVAARVRPAVDAPAETPDAQPAASTARAPIPAIEALAARMTGGADIHRDPPAATTASVSASASASASASRAPVTPAAPAQRAAAGASPRAPATADPSLSDAALTERAATIATLGWAPLKEAVAHCTACALCTSRRNTVFGVGHVQAHWMVIGEAPGEQEDLKGEPFVGPAGQLLDQMLRAVGLSRGVAGESAGEAQAGEVDDAGDPGQRVYIANTLKCRPPRNRNPEPEEMARCEPFLQRQVALVRPKLILAMGRFAVRQLLKSDEAIGKLRGRVHRYDGVPVVVTYHPAYLLRNLPDKAKAWEDLCLARSVAPSLPPEGEPGSARM